MTPLLLDLCCCAGGATIGYRRAGFDVIGVDIDPQPNYPSTFIQADAIAVLRAVIRNGHYLGIRPDAVHISPPCQRWTTGTNNPDRHPDLITPARELLTGWNRPWIMENVPQAPLVNPVRLCGSSFGLGVRRHRHFESNIDLDGSVCFHAAQGTPVGVYGQHPDRKRHYRPDGTQRGTKATSLADGMAAMGIDHPMTWPELAESIPPVYTEWLGKQIT